MGQDGAAAVPDTGAVQLRPYSLAVGDRRATQWAPTGRGTGTAGGDAAVPSSGAGWVLAPDPAAVRAARRFVADRCGDGSAPENLCDTAVLLVSELETNAFTQGRSDARVTVAASPKRVLVEVSDDSSRRPRMVEQDPDALDGRGLPIIDLLSSRWGVRDDRCGETVWFELVGDEAD